MTRRLLLLVGLASSLSACSMFGTAPDYSGPADYAYTLRVGCFCLYVGPLRITVQDDEVVDVRQLEPMEGQGNIDDWIEQQAMTLDDLDALVDRARREAADVTVEYDPVHGYPADVYIDWIKDAVDDEIGYTVTDYVAL